MKIVFFNVWGKEMQESLVPYLTELAADTDVFCLQEATAEMKRRCAAAFEGYRELSHAKYIADNHRFDQTILTRKGLDIAASGVLMAEATSVGLANYIEVKSPSGSLFICNVHGTARPNDKLDDPARVTQSQTLIDYFAGRSGQVIIGGDFNILPQAQSIEMFRGAGYGDLIKDYKIDTTRNRHAWDRFETKMLYSDYVFVNELVKVTSFSVPKNEVSDHLPMLLEIE